MQRRANIFLAIGLALAIFIFAITACKQRKTPNLIKTYDASNQLEKEYFINSKGQKNGTYKEYYSDRKLKFLYNYRSDTPEGLQKSFYDNGNLKSEGYFKNGKLDSIQRWYFQHMVLKRENYRFNNQLFGVQKEFDSNGVLRSLYFMGNDSALISSLELNPSGHVSKKTGNLIYCVYSDDIIKKGDTLKAIFYVVVPPKYHYKCEVIEISHDKKVSRTKVKLEKINNNNAVLIQKQFLQTGQHNMGLRINIYSEQVKSNFVDSMFLEIKVQ